MLSLSVVVVGSWLSGTSCQALVVVEDLLRWLWLLVPGVVAVGSWLSDTSCQALVVVEDLLRWLWLLVPDCPIPVVRN